MNPTENDVDRVPDDHPTPDAPPPSGPAASPATGAPKWWVLSFAVVYVLYLGWNWLPLDYSDRELSASASRVWDIQRELLEHGSLPWWTPYYMSGSSYALNHSQGFYLVPWLLFATFASLPAAGKLMALTAILASAVAMYHCARHFLRHDWAAALAAIAFVLHPEHLIRAATTEHMGVAVFLPFVPLAWLFVARALASGGFRDAFWCAVAVLGMVWSQNKQAFVQFLFLGCYVVYWLWPAERRRRWRPAARGLALVAVLSGTLGGFFILPGLVESGLVKLFRGDPFEGWQRYYSFRSLLALVDRDGALTDAAIRGVRARVAQVGDARDSADAQDAGNSGDTRDARDASTARDTGAARDRDARAAEGTVAGPAAAAAAARIAALQVESPEKYAGLIALVAIAVALVFNRHRQDRGLLWFCVGMLMLGVALAFGPESVGASTLTTVRALMGQPGVPAAARAMVVLAAVAVAAFLGLFAWRKLTTRARWIGASAVLAVFVLVPVFRLLALVPFYREIRAPYVFYDLPAMFFGALLLGFLVTDVLAVGRWRTRVPLAVGLLMVLMLADYWPYQRAMKDCGVPPRTLANLRATYASLADDPDWVKTFSVSSRYFHLLGPMLGGKPQVYEAFFNWMAPEGTGLLNQEAFADFRLHRAFLDLMNARYVVFDKSDASAADPGRRRLLDGYRGMLPVAGENDDFAVFRNPTARPYVSAYADACLFAGDVRASPRLALELSARRIPLVHTESDVAALSADELRGYTRIYVHGERPPALSHLPPDVSARITPMGADTVEIPARPGRAVTLEDVRLERPRNGVVRVGLRAPVTCLVVIAESYYPFWRAEVDGAAAAVRRVSTGLMGIEIAPGEHDIELRYVPPRAYAWAAGVSGLGWLACLGVLIRRRRQAAP